MDKYVIKHPYLGKEDSNGFLEVEITSENIIYSEIQSTHFGLQCVNKKNHNEILVRCKEVVNLIREIDKLNN